MMQLEEKLGGDCDFCDYDFQKYKIINQYIIVNLKKEENYFKRDHNLERWKLMRKVLNFSEKFSQNHAPMKYDCKRTNGENKEYCELWIKEFKEEFKIDK